TSLRRARWRSNASVRRGAVVSHNSAIATRVVAASASSTARPTRRPASLAAAGGPREEDHALGVARHLGEAARQLGGPLCPAAQRHRGPHAGVELVAELLDQTLLVLAHLDVALGDQHLAVPGLHAQELHVPIMA